MGGDREPALRVDEPDGVPRRQPRRHPLAQVESEEVPVARADLLAHHHVHAQLGALTREVTRADRARDRVVVGDRDDVETARGGAHDRFRRPARRR